MNLLWLWVIKNVNVLWFCGYCKCIGVEKLCSNEVIGFFFIFLKIKVLVGCLSFRIGLFGLIWVLFFSFSGKLLLVLFISLMVIGICNGFFFGCLGVVGVFCLNVSVKVFDDVENLLFICK